MCVLATSHVIFTRTLCMKNGETALHLAAQHSSPGTVKMLLDYGADYNIRDKVM